MDWLQQRLRERIAVRASAALGLVAVAVAGLVVLAASIVAGGFEAAERDTLVREVDATHNLVRTAIESMEASARDYANWTDSYDFLDGANPSYPEEGIGPLATTLPSLGLDGLVIVDAGGTLRLGGIVDASGDEVEVPDDLLEWLRQHPLPDEPGSWGATVDVDGRPTLVAVATVVDHDFQHAPNGLLMFTRTIDEALLDQLSAAAPGPLRLATATTSSDLRFTGPETAVGVVPLTDDAGTVAAALEVTLDRPVATAGRTSVRWLAITLVPGLLVATLVFGRWFRRTMVDRIVALDEWTQQLQRGGAPDVEPPHGDDEIGRLAVSFQQLLQQLRDSYQRELEQQERVARARTREEMLGMASHELRTPLTVIAGSLETVMSPRVDPDSELGRHLIERAHARAQDLTAIVNDLLAVVRDDGVAAGEDIEETDVREVVDVALQGLSASDAAHVEVELAPELSDHGLRLSAVHAQHILSNLLANAVKYGAPSYVVRARLEDGEAVIEVCDHGEGVPAGFEAELFEAFSQLRPEDGPATSGVGLGLAVVRRLTTEAGGRVAYHRQGGVTVFRVHLPATRRNAVPVSTEPVPA